MNILITSVGRRAYLVKYFKQAIGNCGEVHACNSSDLTVAFKYADKTAISPLIYSAEYIPFLIDYCKKNKIKILLSLFDADLPVLAKNKSLFEEIGVKVIISNEDFVNICNDKWQTYQFLTHNGFNVPKTYLRQKDVLRAIDSGELSYPIVIKPRFGCGSIGVETVETEEELRVCSMKIENKIAKSYLTFESSKTCDKLIYQEVLNGQEYGVDIINDLDGNFQTCIIKKKIAMRSGETDVAEIVKNNYIERTVACLAKVTKHIANLDCDVFMVGDVPYILEMNARFGGGYPFSHIAGCDLPQAILKWVRGEPLTDELLTHFDNGIIYKEIILTK